MAVFLAGCGPAIRPSFDSPEPAARNRAAVLAAAAEDRGSIRPLIHLLDSDDPATRMIAISSLERITGTTLGYDPAADDRSRAEAILRWLAYARKEAP